MIPASLLTKAGKLSVTKLKAASVDTLMGVAKSMGHKVSKSELIEFISKKNGGGYANDATVIVPKAVTNTKEITVKELTDAGNNANKIEVNNLINLTLGKFLKERPGLVVNNVEDVVFKVTEKRSNFEFALELYKPDYFSINSQVNKPDCTSQNYILTIQETSSESKRWDGKIIYPTLAHICIKNSNNKFDRVDLTTSMWAVIKCEITTEDELRPRIYNRLYEKWIKLREAIVALENPGLFRARPDENTMNAAKKVEEETYEEMKKFAGGKYSRRNTRSKPVNKVK